MKKQILIFSIIIFFLSLLNVKGAVLSGNVSVEFSINNWTSGSSNLKSNKWISTDGELYKTYGGSADKWGFLVLNGTNIKSSTFQVRITSDQITAGVTTLDVDHIQVKVYYVPKTNVTLTSPTPVNNSIIGSTLIINASANQNINANGCKLQNNRNGTYVNETMLINGNNCTLTLNGLNNGTFFYNVVAITSGGTGITETRNISVKNLPSLVQLNSPANNTINLNLTWLLNWTVNNTQSDNVIVKGYISQNTTNNITKQMFYYDEGNINGTYIYNFTAMMTPINSSQQLWALYRFDNDSDYSEGFSRIYDYSGNNKNGTFVTTQNIRQGKFGRSMFHAAGGGTSGDVSLTSSQFANVSVNGMSINAWVNFSGSALTGIVSRYTSSGNDQFFTFRTDGSNKLNFAVYENGNNTLCAVSSSTSTTGGVWTMATGTYNKTEVRVYLNGVLEGNTTCSFNGINQTAWQDTENVIVGRLTTGGLNGTIDELGFWNRSLSAQEISDLYTLKNDTYYWYLESNEYNASNSRINTSLFQFTIGEVGEVVDNCAYTSGNWNPPCTCAITNNILIDSGANITLNTAGTFTVSANISNYNYLFLSPVCTIDIKQGSYLF